MDSSQQQAFGIFASAGFIIFCVVLAVFFIICYWKIFEKAGQPGWAAIVPIYNAYILTKIIGKPGWWTILLLIPYLNIIFGIWAINLLSKSFGKDILFTLGLLILSIIFIPIMAFDRTIQYKGPAGNPSAGLDGQVKSIGSDL